MNKYNVLSIALCVGFSVTSIASEDTKPSFVESTKKDLEIASILYTTAYVLAHGVGSPGLALMHATMEADFERFMAKENGEKISFKKTAHTFAKELKDGFFHMNKGIIRSHRIAAPVVLGGVVTHSLYKKANS